jgi:hypothetical protein
MDEFLLIDHFQPHVGKICRFKGTRYAMPLHRIQTARDGSVPEGMKRKPFILIFRAPKEPEHLPEGRYDCEIQDGPTYPMYVMPILTSEPAFQDYQAVFA